MRTGTKRVQFTELRLRNYPTPEKRQTIYDKEIPQLGLRLEPSGKRTFFWFRSVAGKLVFRTIGQFQDALSLEQARAKAIEFNHERAEWKAGDKSGPSPFETPKQRDTVLFKDLMAAYINTQIRHFTHHPAAAEKNTTWVWKKYLAEFDHRPITSITRKEIKEFHSRKGEQSGPTSVNLAVKVLKTVFNWAIDQELFTGQNPAAQIKKFPESSRTRFLQPDELVRLKRQLAIEENQDLIDFVAIALGSAARYRMIVTADWSEVNVATGVWTVPASKMKSKKGNELAFTPQLSGEAVRAFERRWLEAGQPSEGWVFPSRRHMGKYRDDFGAKLRVVLAKCGIKDLWIHDLRRTKASYAMIAGAPLVAISKMLGHRSLQPTMIYARLHDAAVSEAAKLGEAKMEADMKLAEKRMKPRLLA
ncbi:MAG TPA: site-specific integrase [Chthoniobacterales bacterium]|jgi:integrase|nr:site-specific integrase [Chthoniobacterales bacterium]